MNIIIRGTFFLCFLFSTNLGLAEDCEKKAESTSLFQAFKACEDNKLKNSLKNFTAKFINLNEDLKCDQCYFEAELKHVNAVCEDPNGFVCAHNGRVLDSQCNYTLLESEDLEKFPTFIKLLCLAKNEKNTSPKKQAVYVKSQIYSKERIQKVKAVYEEVQRSYISMINSSMKLSLKNKQILADKIANTRLALDPSDLNNSRYSSCHSLSPGESSTAIFNDENLPHPAIHFCIGVMASIDKMNRYSLIQTISHELSHSIDPCALETDMLRNKNPTPFAFNQFYPETILCLRGGSGNDGCKNSILNCNLNQGRLEFCSYYYKGYKIKNCYEQFINSKPSCPAGKPDPEYNSQNSADYEKSGPGKDQIREAFSDFMGAENTSHFLKNEKSKTEKTDALVSIASEYSRLHGACLKSNTSDLHPPGFIRTNRIIMSNELFRQSIGCQNGPPKTLKANVTCPGI